MPRRKALRDGHVERKLYEVASSRGSTEVIVRSQREMKDNLVKLLPNMALSLVQSVAHVAYEGNVIIQADGWAVRYVGPLELKVAEQQKRTRDKKKKAGIERSLEEAIAEKPETLFGI